MPSFENGVSVALFPASLSHGPFDTPGIHPPAMAFDFNGGA